MLGKCNCELRMSALPSVDCCLSDGIRIWRWFEFRERAKRMQIARQRHSPRTSKRLFIVTRGLIITAATRAVVIFGRRLKSRKVTYSDFRRLIKSPAFLSISANGWILTTASVADVL